MLPFGDDILLNDLLKNHISGIPEHAELRAQINTNRGVSIVSGNLVSNIRSESSGVSARVYKNGVWGFAAKGEYSDEAIKDVLNAARNNADFLNTHAGRGKPPLVGVQPPNNPLKRDFIDVPQSAYVDFCRQLDDYIATKYTNLASRTVMARADSMEKLLYVSDGGFSHAIMPRAYIYVILSAETADGDTVELFEVINGGEGYFSELYNNIDECYKEIDNLYEELMKKREGIFPNAGVSEVVLDAALAGMLAHEAVGHTVEADLVMAGSVASKNLGREVASEKITMIDFAHTALGEKAPLPLYVDEEGTPCEDAVLIKNGILVGYMHDRESAMHFEVKPTGNARAHKFSDEPLIRMRNTAILPGKDKLSDLIASIDNGYYLTRTQNGQADTTGEFMFGITMGYEIKNGKLGRALRDTTISGVAFEMLKTVDMISDEMVWSSSGYCGKKQLMPVSMGGPSLKCKVNIGGR